MGWHGRALLPNETKRQYVEKQFNTKDYTILKGVGVRNTYYFAVRENATGNVHAAVVLTRMDSGFFLTKFIGEEDSPCEFECPKSILAMLTPSENGCAKEWRERCRKQIEVQDKLKAMPVGTTMKVIYMGQTDIPYTVTKTAPYGRSKQPRYLCGSNATYLRVKGITEILEVC